MNLNIVGFYNAVSSGLLSPSTVCYDYIDPVKFNTFLEYNRKDKKRLTVLDAFKELHNRMSQEYFSDVFLAQVQAMCYAGVRFPTYHLILSEDLTEDWLATVDFHKKYARDHSIHQPLTAYIVAELLGYGEETRSLIIPARPHNLLGFCVDHIFNEAHYILDYARAAGLPESLLDRRNNNAVVFWRRCFYETAILSAFFHDMGYPWQFVGRIDNALERCIPFFEPTVTNAKRIISLFGERLVFYPLYHYKRAINPPSYEQDRIVKLVCRALGSHGFPGALAFLALNDAVRKTEGYPVKGFLHDVSVEWAAMGIMMHDMAGLHNDDSWRLQIDFQKDPLSSIVSMADYLEEFNRPSVLFSSHRDHCDMLFNYACSEVAISIDSHRDLLVEMKCCQKAHLALARHYKTAETELYFNPSSGFINLTGLGIRKVKLKCGL